MLNNPFSLQGKVIIITGASSGIGQQCAIDCSHFGARVLLVGRNLENLQKTTEMIDKGLYSIYQYDLTDLEHIENLVKKMVEENGKIDGLINCAGISGTEPIKIISNKRLQEYFETNVYAAFALTRELTKIGRYNSEGCSIVFMASIMGLVGEAMKVAYSMTKGALISGCKSMAVEYANKRIRVNCISPGVILTPINSQQPYMKDPDMRKLVESKHLLGFGKTTDISNACIYLLSEASRWITGQNIVIDGGYTIQ
jgi:NAD(P)-dependent dehydrogenase (short-subunit alcohol dehydrogenase family)